MTRLIVVACAAMAALVSHASGTKELYDGDKLADAVADEAAYDEIILHKGTYPITSTVVVDRKMTIRGADGTTPDEVVLDGDNKRRLVNLTSGSAGSLISGVTLTRGKVKGAYEEWISGAAVLMQTASIVSNCVISANTLEDKGASGIVHMQAAGCVLSHCVVKDNIFSRGGGYGSSAGLAVALSGTGYLRNCLFVGNKTTKADDASRRSGLITPRANATAWVVNCTFVDNHLHTLYLLQGYSSGVIKTCNSIFIGNTKDGAATVGSATFWNCLADVTLSGTGCGQIDASIFADYANGDYALTKNSTAAIDKGTQKADSTAVAVESTDLAGNDRVMGKEVDIGCYEFDPNERSVFFTVTPDGGTEPVDLTFEATPNGLGEEPTYYWDFDGDGTADIITNKSTFTKTFTSGTYPVKLTAVDATSGGSASYERLAPIIVDRVVAAFEMSETSGMEPLPVTLAANCPWIGDHPQYSWDFNGDGVIDLVTAEALVQNVFQRGNHPVTLFASNLTYGVGNVVANMLPVAQGITYKADTDWFFEPFGEPLKVTLTSDLGETPKFYWDLNDDGVAEAITDVPVWRPTLAAGEYHVTVCASNVEAGVGVTIAAEDGMTILPRPRVTVTAADPEVGITAADIQATIDAAERGSIVTIPAGTYDVKGTPIEVVKEIELRGETGNPKDVVLKNTATHHRIMNVDGGTHCLIHSLTLANGKGTKGNSETYEFGSGLMIASANSFEAASNGTRGNNNTKGGCVSNVVVRGCTCGGNYGDPCTVYLKGPKARLTHSVISNNSATVTWGGKPFNTLALFIGGGAMAENVLVCNNTCTESGSYPSYLTVPVAVNGARSVLRFSTIVNNVGGICGGVNVYDGGRVEHCVIAGGRAFDGGGVARRNVWATFTVGDNLRISSNTVDGRKAARDTEAANAAKEEIYSIQTNNAVDVADCLNETTVYATKKQLVPIYRNGAWRLPKGSPAIDVVPAKDVSGMSATDLNGNRRLVNTLYDLGAFELPNPCGLMLLVK